LVQPLAALLTRMLPKHRNDPEQQEKIVKYGDLIANAVIFRNVVDLTDVLLPIVHFHQKLGRTQCHCRLTARSCTHAAAWNGLLSGEPRY
jgi:hypothetical protein